jgi:hypothetical protein
MENRELQELDRYRSFLELGWDDKTAWHLVRSGAPLLAPKGAKAANAKHEVEAPKRRGRRPRRQSVDTRVSDKRLREAMLKAVNKNGRVNRGVRRLAEDAGGISEASVRRALKAWEASGQLTREDRGRGKTQSIKLDLGHPAWSEYLPSHPSRS